MTLPEPSLISPFVRDALAVVHQQSLELIVRGASLDAVLEALCDGIDALDPNLASSVLLADPDGQLLWPKAGRRVPEDYKQLITPLPIAPSMGACGTAAFRKERVISADIATDPLWSGPVEHCREMALQHGFRAAWSVPIVSDNGELLGTFGLHHAQSKSVSTQDIELLEKAGHIALIAIERTRAQKALTDALAELKKSERELRTIIDMIPQMIAVLGSDGQALYVNDLTLEYTGLSGDEARGAEFRRRVFHPDDVDRLQEERRDAFVRGEPFENEQRARRHDGHYRWFLIRYRPMRDGDGRVVRWYATATDIDDRKQAEDRIRNENVALREEIDRSSMFEEIVGSSKPLRRVLTLVDKVAATDSTVLILGETGTGKELIARAIHKKSHRADSRIHSRQLRRHPALARRVGALRPRERARSRARYSGVSGDSSRPTAGRSSSTRSAICLRKPRSRCCACSRTARFERLGNSHSIPVDVRVVAATNRDLEDAVAAGTFRQDLFYRLNVFPIHVPSLRERAEDIPLLVEYLIERYATKAGKRIRKISRSALTLFQAYEWPGNIRELQNVIERAVILCDGDTFSVDETWLTRHPKTDSRTKHFDRHLVSTTSASAVRDRATDDRGRLGRHAGTGSLGRKVPPPNSAFPVRRSTRKSPR